MQPTTGSIVRFSSSTGEEKAKPTRRSRPKNGPVIVTKIEPKAMTKPKISPAVAEHLARTGRLPRIGR